FFQAEDGIRDFHVTGVQTCALPICWIAFAHKAYNEQQRHLDFALLLGYLSTQISGSGYLYALQGEVLSENLAQHDKAIESYEARSEERRVGKECRARRTAYQ